MTITILTGCCLSMLAGIPDKSINTCVTSPPYFGLRDYGHAGQLGLEPTPDAYVANMVKVFREVRRALRDDGTLWLNIGDSYAGYHGNKNAEIPTSARNGWTNGTDENKRGDKRPQDIGLKPKDLIGIPWLLAFALRADGWYLRSDVIWHKPNPMPESVTDRPTKSHEYIFLLSKNEKYYYDQDAIAEPVTASTIERLSQPNLENQIGSDRVPGKTNGNMKAVSKRDSFKRENSKRAAVIPGQLVGTHRPDREDTIPGLTRNKRSVWTVATKPYSEAHFATYPPELIEPCILAGSPKGGMVLDPFFGAGTTGLVSDRLGRSCTGIELNPEYVEIAKRRLSKDAGMFADITAA